jgi:hypothetical protein
MPAVQVILACAYCVLSRPFEGLVLRSQGGAALECKELSGWSWEVVLAAEVECKGEDACGFEFRHHIWKVSSRIIECILSRRDTDRLFLLWKSSNEINFIFWKSNVILYK